MIRLTVHDGKIAQTVTLSGDKVFIGRLDGNTVRLDHPSVSRKHCLVRRTGTGGLEVLDLNSRHGTLRGGEKVERALLAVGDEFSVGEVRVRVESLEGPVEAPPEPEPRKAPEAGAPPAKALVSQMHRRTFAEELYGQVRRTPWWAASLCVHAILVWLFFSTPFTEPPGENGLGEVTGSIEDDFSRYLVKELIDPAEMLREMKPPAEPLPSPPLVENVPIPVEPVLPPDEMEQWKTPVLGPTTMDFTAGALKTSPFTAPSVPDVEFGQDGAESANRTAGALLRKSLRGRAGETIGLGSQLRVSQVLVVGGHYDKVENVLDLFDMKREEVSVRKLERTELGDRRVLIVNCSNERPSRATVDRIRDFVKGGGYLLTTDWGIENVLKDAFPGYIEPLADQGRNVITPNEVIRIHAAPDKRNHFLLSGTSLDEGEAKWWLEESSYPFVVKRPADVEVLIESDDLAREYRARAVAATFRYGEGRVLHMLGHFFQKEGNLKGAFSTQRLIANFLVAAVRKR